VRKPLSQPALFSYDRSDRHSEVNYTVHTKRAFFVETPFTLFRVIQASVYGVMCGGLSLPAVVAVAALDKLHILPVALINDEIFGASPTMKP
jgi:hypothetical protein